MVLVISGWTIFFAVPADHLTENQTRIEIPLNPISSVTPSATATAKPSPFTFLEPTARPTPGPGGQVLILTPQAKDTGWVVNDDDSNVTVYDPQNHFGDSYLYAGVLDEKIYHAAFQFDLSHIPRGIKVYGASLRLVGLRAVQMDEGRRGTWQVHLLASEIDPYWDSVTYQQLKNAVTWTTLEPLLVQKQLGEGQTYDFDLSPKQIALLERRLVEGNDELGSQVSFRIDGPQIGSNNLFAWDSGYGPASRGMGPELFLNLGPPPAETPLPYYQVVTSTPTPENIMTAAVISIQITAAAIKDGTATPLPANWVTPFVVTVTPTPQNEATAILASRLATALALTTGEPLNMVTATPTPTYVIITSTPTPENVMTAAAHALQITAAAIKDGTATPLPGNWVTPVVVITTPTPENVATLEYWQAVALTTGTPTPTPANVQTATATPVFVAVDMIPSPTATATPSPTPQLMPAALMGKIIFLTDREGATEEERRRAGLRQVTPQITPQPYVFDPETGQLSRLTNIWPYQGAVDRDAWSADLAYEAYTQELLWTNNVDGRSATRLAIHYYDYIYKTEQIVTRMGIGIVYDPAWSPVSDEIAFVATESGNDEIWVINRDGSNVRQLTRNEWEWDKHPTWSPDGQSILFYSNRTGNNQLWIMNKDGSNQRLLMDWTPFNDWDPVWIKYREPRPPLAREPDWRFIKPQEEQ